MDKIKTHSSPVKTILFGPWGQVAQKKEIQRIEKIVRSPIRTQAIPLEIYMSPAQLAKSKQTLMKSKSIEHETTKLIKIDVSNEPQAHRQGLEDDPFFSQPDRPCDADNDMPVSNSSSKTGSSIEFRSVPGTVSPCF